MVSFQIEFQAVYDAFRMELIPFIIRQLRNCNKSTFDINLRVSLLKQFQASYDDRFDYCSDSSHQVSSELISYIGLLNLRSIENYKSENPQQ